jgi:hypothetical protein
MPRVFELFEVSVALRPLEVRKRGLLLSQTSPPQRRFSSGREAQLIQADRLQEKQKVCSCSDLICFLYILARGLTEALSCPSLGSAFPAQLSQPSSSLWRDAGGAVSATASTAQRMASCPEPTTICSYRHIDLLQLAGVKQAVQGLASLGSFLQDPRQNGEHQISQSYGRSNGADGIRQTVDNDSTAFDSDVWINIWDIREANMD